VGGPGAAIQAPDALLDEEDRMKRAVIGCALGLGLVLGSAVSAQAGEVNGRGLPIPGAHVAHSLCAFSGKDLPDSVEHNPIGRDDDAINGVGNTQSYGVFVRNGLKAAVPSPGVACNPTKGVPEPE
jgi:hypothetical protein